MTGKAGERILRVRSLDLDDCMLAFAGCDAVVEDLRTILRGWDVREVDAGRGDAVVRLRRTRKGYLRVSPWSRTPEKCREAFRTHNTDALFGVHYDLLRWYVDAQRTRPCLHSAAVRFGSGLVVFPNTTKAGKSTLAVQLAISGHQVFSDDWLPIVQPGNRGLALGILPWLRLPAPAAARDEFKAFLKDRHGPRNRRWTYVGLLDDELAGHGSLAPISGLVLLERQAQGPARLAPVTKDRMLTELILQNYAQQVPCAEVFDALHALVDGVGGYRLTYASLPDAVRELQGAFGGFHANATRH
jgi:hypothetical protein